MKQLLAICIKVLSLSALLPVICLAAASPSYTITGDALLNGGGSTASPLYSIHGSALGQAFFNPTGSMGSPSYKAGVLTIGNPEQAERQHTLIVSFGGSGYGKVTGDAGLFCVGTEGDICGMNLFYSTAINLTATPLSSATFVGWSGDCTGTGSCQVTMGADRAVTALFISKAYTISASAGDHGSITPTSTVNHGSSELYTVTPDDGYHIITVSIDGISQSISNPNSFNHIFSNVTTNHTISASFAIDTFIAKLGNCVSGPATIRYNETPTYTFTPGFSVVAYINGTAVALANNSYTYPTGVVSNQTVTGVFTINPVGANDPIQVLRGAAVVDTHTTLQAAYNAAESGDVIMMKGITFAGGLTADRKIAVTIKGGYEATFASSCVMTNVGKIVVKAGVVRVQRVSAR